MTVTVKEIIDLKRKVLTTLNEKFTEDRINAIFDDFLIEKDDSDKIPLQLHRSPFGDKTFKGFEVNDSKGFNGDITPNVFFKDDGDKNPL